MSGCARVQFGTVEARAYVSGKASWRADLCGMGAGLHARHVPGLGCEARTHWDQSADGRCVRGLPASDDVVAAVRAALLHKQTVVNFPSEPAGPFVVWRKSQRVVGVGVGVWFGEPQQKGNPGIRS